MRLMPPALAAAAAAALFGLSACATTGEPNPSYGEELQRLADDCHARGGILRPTSTAMGPNAAADYACSITGGASRLNRD